eukprot:2266264-Amphidinium_carterae.1
MISRQVRAGPATEGGTRLLTDTAITRPSLVSDRKRLTDRVLVNTATNAKESLGRCEMAGCADYCFVECSTPCSSSVTSGRLLPTVSWLVRSPEKKILHTNTVQKFLNK